MPTATKPAAPADLQTAYDWIVEHFAESPSLPEIAAQAGLSTFHFQRRFKAFFGTTPKRVADRLRIAEAKRLLLQGVDQCLIAAGLGFAHQSHLCAVFRRYAGLPPGRWLTQQLNQGRSPR